MSLSTLSNQLKIETFKLRNGVTVYYKRFEGAPRIALNVYVYGGNRIEPQPGVTDLIDNLLLEGTHSKTAEQISIQLDSLTLDVDTDTRRDYSVMSATFLEEDLEQSISFVTDLLFQSSFAEFEKEKIRLQGDLMMDLDSPRNRAHDLLMTTMLKDTPYKASHSRILKTLETLADVALLKQHYQQAYHPNNLHVVLVGDLPAEPVLALLEQYIQPSSQVSYQDAQPVASAVIPASQYITESKDDTNQLHLYKAWFVPHQTHADYAPLVVLNTILGGAGLTSRLFLELRDKQGLAYVVRSQYEASKYLGLFSLYIGTEPSNRQKALTGFEVECQKLIDIPVSESELAEAKENIVGRRVVFLETAPQLCGYIGANLALGSSLESLAALPGKIQAVTASEVQRVAQAYLTQPSIISAVGPSAFL